MFSTQPVGGHAVYVCTNISCSLRGADKLYAAMQDAAGDDPDLNVRAFECLGACDIAPMASVNGAYVGPLELARRGDDRRAAAPARSAAGQAAAARKVADPRAASSGGDAAMHGARASPRRGRAQRLGREGAERLRCGRQAVPRRGPGMTELLLFKDIDEPGLATIDVYKRRGGYQSLERALRVPREEVLQDLLDSGLRGRGGAGFAMGKKASFLPKGTMDKYLVCNADESEPGTFKDRELMQKSPHMLVEGMIIAAYAADANRSFIYIRGEYQQQAEILERAIAEAQAAGYLGERILGSDHSLSARAAPRRRRLHLRRGDGPARLARGQARQPAPEAAVPRQPGPLPGPDADQQRRDARDRAARSSRWAGRSTRSSAPRRRPARSSCRSPATSSGPATTRSSWGSRRGRSSTAWPAGRSRAAR